MTRIERYAPLAGRILLSLIFLLSGIGKIGNFAGTAGYMAAKGMPLVPLLLLGAIAFEIGGGLSLLVGYKARLGALLLIVFLVPTTVIFHNFLAAQGPEREMQMVNFLKNLGILGGLSLVLAYGSGPLSIDSRTR